MKIRKMKQSDFKEMYTLWEKIGPAVNLASINREEKEVIAMIRLNKNSCFVVVENGKIVGTVFGVFNGRRAWMYHLAVDSMYQNKGIGSVLVKKAEKALVKAGATKIRLWVAESNTQVIAFYAKQGYKKIPSTILGKDF